VIQQGQSGELLPKSYEALLKCMTVAFRWFLLFWYMVCR